MMRLWTTSYARRERTGFAGIASVGAHAVVVVLWVIATLPPTALPSEGLVNRLYYIPPPDKPPPSRESHETVQYIALEGLGRGLGKPTIDASKPFTAAQQSVDAGGAKVDSTPPSPPSTPVFAPEHEQDSVFTELEVDSAVVRSQLSAAPAYPLDLLAKHVEGMVVVRYVVDTTGFADTVSFTVVRATDPGFTRAVRDVLPFMRFSPAKIGTKKVRQLVEQPFTFKIAPSAMSGVKP
jgi:TonB family protein